MRGTYAGLGQPSRWSTTSDALGVTSVELLPIHTFVNDSHLLEKKLTNYWGYNTIGFFAPDPRYAADVANCLREFKEMVPRLHDAGLEVILDVVYNHTAEGNELGPTLSFKGIDNARYYRLLPDQPRYYINDTGTGNTLNLCHPRVIQMVADSLRYWVSEMHVDGFRFDLGTILAREPDGFDTESGFLKAVGQDPLLAEVKLIAEPWDCGPGGYQVGGFPPGWAEWNDIFRDAVARLLAGRDERESACAAALRVAPTYSISAAESRGQASISSSPMTASRLTTSSPTTTSTTRRTARTTATAIRDNRSWNCGVEGPTEDPEIQALRQRQMRNFLATLLLSQGTPMVLRGRRIRPHPGRQQQRLLPGQRDQLARLETGRGPTGAHRVFPAPDRIVSAISGPAPIPVFHRPDEPGHRRAGRNLDRRERRADDGRDLGRRPHALFRHASRWARPGQRDQATRRGRDPAHRVQRAPRPGEVRIAGMLRFRPAGARLFDTNDPSLPAEEFAFGAVYEVTGRSMLLFERVPSVKAGRDRGRAAATAS